MTFHDVTKAGLLAGVFVDSAIQTTNSQRDIQIERELELKEAMDDAFSAVCLKLKGL